MLHYINGSYGHYDATVEWSIQLCGGKGIHRQLIGALGHTCRKPLNKLSPGVDPIKLYSMYFVLS
jgi:hypothetical protein